MQSGEVSLWLAPSKSIHTANPTYWSCKNRMADCLRSQREQRFPRLFHPRQLIVPLKLLGIDIRRCLRTVWNWSGAHFLPAKPTRVSLFGGGLFRRSWRTWGKCAKHWAQPACPDICFTLVSVNLRLWCRWKKHYRTLEMGTHISLPLDGPEVVCFFLLVLCVLCHIKASHRNHHFRQRPIRRRRVRNQWNGWVRLRRSSAARSKKCRIQTKKKKESWWINRNEWRFTQRQNLYTCYTALQGWRVQSCYGVPRPFLAFLFLCDLRDLRDLAWFILNDLRDLRDLRALWPRNFEKYFDCDLIKLKDQHTSKILNINIIKKQKRKYRDA